MLAFTPPAWKKQSVQSLTNPTISVATLRARSKCASEIIPRLYLSDFSTVTTPEELARLRVTHVVSVMEDAPSLKEVKGVQLKRLHIPVSDVASSDLSQWFEQTNAWIGEALQDERNVVLVHCLMGMSRSASIVAAYLIATRQLHAPDAITFIRVRRRIIRPNPGFVRQLEIYSQTFDRSLKAIPSSTTDTASTTAKADNDTNEDEALMALKVRTSLASRIRRYMISTGMKKMQDQK